MKFFIVLLFLDYNATALASDGLKDALQQALENSEQDHQKQQVTFKVSPEQVRQATFKQPQSQVIEVPSSLTIDEAGEVQEKINLAGGQ